MTKPTFNLELFPYAIVNMHGDVLSLHRFSERANKLAREMSNPDYQYKVVMTSNTYAKPE